MASGGTVGRVLSGGGHLPEQAEARNGQGEGGALTNAETAPAAAGEQFCGLGGEGR